jgi:hypothetical protein
MTTLQEKPIHSEIILYQSEDGKTRIDVRLKEETVWLTQKMMAELFQKDVRTINEHLRNIFTEKELEPDPVIRKFRITAELQALNRKPIYMKDWIPKLDDFLRTSEREILTYPGKISHEEAMVKARGEYEKYRKQILEAPSSVERHFMEAVREVKELGKEKPKRRPVEGK